MKIVRKINPTWKDEPTNYTPPDRRERWDTWDTWKVSKESWEKEDEIEQLVWENEFLVNQIFNFALERGICVRGMNAFHDCGGQECRECIKEAAAEWEPLNFE